MDLRNLNKNKLLRLTVFLLFTIAFLLLVSLFLFLHQIKTQEKYGAIINVSGKQRMLSQKILKDCILFSQNIDTINQANLLESLHNDLIDFKAGNLKVISFSNSREIKRRITELQINFNKIIQYTERICNNKNQIVEITKSIQFTESTFLRNMNAVVNLYEKELGQKQSNFKYFIIGVIVSLILIFLTIIIFLLIPNIRISEKNKEDLKQKNNELLKVNATKDTFFKIIAHDLRNPFNSIIGFTDLLISDGDKFEKKEFDEILKMVNTQAVSTYNLLENLLEWSRTQTGEIQYKPIRIDLERLFLKLELKLVPLAEIKEMHLRFTVKENMIFKADINMLNAILRNLVSNAIKFSHRKNTIHISAERKNKMIEFSVSDNGIGLSPEDKENLFKAGHFITHWGTDNEKGSGLGLTLCKDFVKLHGGEIWVESLAGKGSKFIFTIPFIPVETAKAKPE